MAMATFTAQQLEALQTFLKDWLRHAGRTQADLRRALQASSIRMPVLLEVLEHTYRREGLAGLASQLCAVEERWQLEDGAVTPAPASAGGKDAGSGAGEPSPGEGADFGQLDQLLLEIRGEQTG